MDAGTMLTVVQTLITVLDSRTLQDFSSFVDVEKKIKTLQSTLSAINAVRLDAEESGVLSHVERDWLQKLQDVVYEAEDVVDAFNTLSHQQTDSHNKLLKKAQYFFSLMGMSKELRKIMGQLKVIANERQNYGNVHHTVIREKHIVRRKDTPSSGADEDAVGRDQDKKEVMDMLLDLNIHAEENFTCVFIVGIGGMGKTALAQLVYNDEKFKSGFTRLWVCVPEDFDLKSLIIEILLAATNKEPQNLRIDQLQSQLQKEIGGKRILLVLDDVWNNNRIRWLEFKRLLVGVGEGSKVLVTTRSKEVATALGEYPIHELQGLSEEASWCLFEKMAFGHGQEQSTVNVELVGLGKEIVKKCANVPLAIRTVGSLLYGKDKRKWISFKNNDLASIKQDDDDILPTLKLSYRHLPAVLRRCFSYCAIFPKGYVIKKDLLINLWMAEGYISPSLNDDPEDIGEDYFESLLERCFFQNIQRDKWGEIRSFKIHDLLHALAINIAKNEGIFFTMQQSTTNYKKLRRLSRQLTPNEFEKWIAFYLGSKSRHSLPSIYTCLRVLDLSYSHPTVTLSWLDKLIHLRYLDLSRNSLHNLPESITKLWNLQILRLHNCNNLKQLPRKFYRLVNLKHLDISGCSALECMPPHLDALTGLRTLSMFIVCNFDNVGYLQDLKGLKHLKGELTIKIGDCSCCLEKTKGADLRSKQHLSGLCLMFEDVNIHDHKRDEALLEDLQPPMNVRVLSIEGYRGKSLPSWLPLNSLESMLPKLVKISLLNSTELKCLPSFSKLPWLKSLKLEGIPILYMENRSASSMSTPDSTLFFPSLEYLLLVDLHDLKGWFKPMETLDDNGDEDDEEVHSLSASPLFPRLSKLVIRSCPNLVSFPLCPFVVHLHISDLNDRLSILEKMAVDVVTTSATSSQPNSSVLKKLTIGNVSCLVSLPEGSLQSLSYFAINTDCELENLSTIEEVVFQRLASVRFFKISFCDNLKTLKAGGLQHLTTLETLEIYDCPELELKDEDGDDGILPWKPLGSRLRSLTLANLPKVENLPKGWQYFSSLQSLEIQNVGLTSLPEWIGSLKFLQYLEIAFCPKLTSLPESMRDLTALNQLGIYECQGLTKRCKEPDGEDWPKIQHILCVHTQGLMRTIITRNLSS